MQRQNVICFLLVLLNNASVSPLANQTLTSTKDSGNTTFKLSEQLEKPPSEQKKSESDLKTTKLKHVETPVTTKTTEDGRLTSEKNVSHTKTQEKSSSFKEKTETGIEPELTAVEPVKVKNQDSEILKDEKPDAEDDAKVVLGQDSIVESSKPTENAAKETVTKVLDEKEINKPENVDDNGNQVNEAVVVKTSNVEAENDQVPEEPVLPAAPADMQGSSIEDNAEKVDSQNDNKRSNEVVTDLENAPKEPVETESPPTVDQVPDSEDEPAVASDNSGNVVEEPTQADDGSKTENVAIDKVGKPAESADDKQEHVKLEVDSIQSFEEWKKKQIQNREEAAVDIGTSSHRKIRTKKTQVNYASQDCGAKILAHNQEAKHVSAILDENKDMYMLNPCSVNIWFVVELCEPIQVRQLQLANLELFSSAPKLFGVHVSERYPAREWHQLGNFEARNERLVQTFPLKHQNDLMFAKYIKFEMKSHFGNEHFCPLTLVRVLGVSMVEEYEESEEKESKKTQPVDEDTVPISEMKDESGGVVPSDRVDEDGVSIGKVLNIMKSAVGNLLGNGVESGGNDNSSSWNATESQDAANKTQEDDSFDPNWESQVTLVTNKSEVERSKVGTDRPLVTLVQTGDGQEIVYLGASEFDPPPLVDLTFLKQFSTHRFSAHLCWFLEFVYRVSILSCIVQPHSNQTSVSHAFVETVRKPPSNVTSTKPAPEEIAPPSGELAKTVLTEPVEAESKPRETSQRSAGDGAPISGGDKGPEADVDAVEPSDEAPPVAKKPIATELESDRKAVEIPKVLKGETLEDKNKCEIPEDSPPQGDAKSDVTSNDVTADKSPDGEANSAVNAATDEKTDKDSMTSSDDDTVPPNEGGKSDDVSEDEKDSDTVKSDGEDNMAESQPDKGGHTEEKIVNDRTENNDKVAPPSEDPAAEQAPPTPSPLTPQEEPSTAIPPLTGRDTANGEQQLNAIEEDQVVINPGTNQKESVLMRLSNRIRALEQNMSLSSDYLEDLSQRYRRQMDEMQKAFNRTKTKLADAARRAEESEQKQTEAIHLAHNKTAFLQDQVSEMTDGFEYLNRQMVARHLCLMALESVVLIVITVTCFGARQIRLAKRVERAEKLVQLLYQQQQDAKVMNGHIPSSDKSGVKKRKIAVKQAPRPKVEGLHHSFAAPAHLSDARKSSRSPEPSPTHARRKSLKTPFGAHKKHRGATHQGGQITKSRKSNGVSTKSASSSVAGTGPAAVGCGYHGNRRGSGSGTLISDILAAAPVPRGPKTGLHAPAKQPEPPARVLGVAFAREIPSNVPCRNDHMPWASTPGVLSGKAR